MAVTKKEVVIEEVEVSEVKVVAKDSPYAKLLEAYKLQNPVKYELKKAELLAKLNK